MSIARLLVLQKQIRQKEKEAKKEEATKAEAKKEAQTKPIVKEQAEKQAKKEAQTKPIVKKQAEKPQKSPPIPIPTASRKPSPPEIDDEESTDKERQEQQTDRVSSNPGDMSEIFSTEPSVTNKPMLDPNEDKQKKSESSNVSDNLRGVPRDSFSDDMFETRSSPSIHESTQKAVVDASSGTTSEEKPPRISSTQSSPASVTSTSPGFFEEMKATIKYDRRGHEVTTPDPSGSESDDSSDDESYSARQPNGYLRGH